MFDVESAHRMFDVEPPVGRNSAGADRRAGRGAARGGDAAFEKAGRDGGWSFGLKSSGLVYSLGRHANMKRRSNERSVGAA